MKNKQISQIYIILLFIILFFSNCAYKKLPSGGIEYVKKSITIEKTYPKNGDYKVPLDTIIYIKFSSPINKTSFIKNFSIFPFNNRYKKIKWLSTKEVIIKLDTLFKDNFTHVVTISNKVTDIYGNYLDKSYTIIFSTSDTIYKNSISGTVFSEDLKPLKDVKIYLKKSIDSLFYDTLFFSLNKINYSFTYSYSNGTYRLQYIPPGTYYIIAIFDHNNNYKIDPEEKLGIFYKKISIYKNHINNIKNVNFILKNYNLIKILNIKFINAKNLIISFNKKIENLPASYKDSLINSLIIKNINNNDTIDIKPNIKQVSFFNSNLLISMEKLTLPNNILIIGYNYKKLDELNIIDSFGNKKLVYYKEDTIAPINIIKSKLKLIHPEYDTIKFIFDRFINIDSSKIKVFSIDNSNDSSFDTTFYSYTLIYSGNILKLIPLLNDSINNIYLKIDSIAIYDNDSNFLNSNKIYKIRKVNKNELGNIDIYFSFNDYITKQSKIRIILKDKNSNKILYNIYCEKPKIPIKLKNILDNYYKILIIKDKFDLNNCVFYSIDSVRVRKHWTIIDSVYCY